MKTYKQIVPWYKIVSEEDLITPSLLVYPDRISTNLHKMIEIAGDVDHLRPHIKTHKIAEIIDLQLKQGINKFKCATIAEAELLAKCGALDILLSLQPVATQIDRFFELIKKYPNSIFSTIVDHEKSVIDFIQKSNKLKTKVNLWIDINNGMNRTGISPDNNAVRIAELITKSKWLHFNGLHVYDGHLHHKDLNEREKACDKDYSGIELLIENLSLVAIKVPKVIAGGTPTFPIHSKRKSVETSPGTPLLWDAGYNENFPDLPFQPAAVLATRVISHPTKDTFCLDLGHKSVASEMPLPRVLLLDIEHSEQISQSEEHLVVKIESGNLPEIGTLFYAIPNHICPTVSKYPAVQTVINNKITGSWVVAARDHQIFI